MLVVTGFTLLLVYRGADLYHVLQGWTRVSYISFCWCVCVCMCVFVGDFRSFFFLCFMTILVQFYAKSFIRPIEIFLSYSL